MRSDMRTPAMLTTEQVAKRLEVSVRAVKRWIKDGELRSHLFGTSRRIADDDLAAFVAKRRK